MAGDEDRLTGGAGANQFDQFGRVFRFDLGYRNPESVGQRLYGLLRAFVLRCINCIDAGIGKHPADLQRARLPRRAQVRVLILRGHNFFFRVPHENYGQHRLLNGRRTCRQGTGPEG